MKPAFGILRQVERRESNAVDRRIDGQLMCQHVIYDVLVTRVVVLWVTVWTHETRW